MLEKPHLWHETDDMRRRRFVGHILRLLSGTSISAAVQWTPEGENFKEEEADLIFLTIERLHLDQSTSSKGI